MQILAKWFGALVFGPTPEPDVVNHPYAKATTPDELIGARIKESLSKNFDNWVLHVGPEPPVYYNYQIREDMVEAFNKAQTVWYRQWNGKVHGNAFTINRVLENKSEGLLFAYTKQNETSRCDFSVNGVPILTEVGEKIQKAYTDIWKAVEKAKAAADEAKRKMEENERKWNLAEQLLGMKRLPNGALVPKEHTDNDCGASDQRDRTVQENL